MRYLGPRFAHLFDDVRVVHARNVFSDEAVVHHNVSARAGPSEHLPYRDFMEMVGEGKGSINVHQETLDPPPVRSSGSLRPDPWNASAAQRARERNGHALSLSLSLSLSLVLSLFYFYFILFFEEKDAL